MQYFVKSNKASLGKDTFPRDINSVNSDLELETTSFTAREGTFFAMNPAK